MLCDLHNHPPGCPSQTVSALEVVHWASQALEARASSLIDLLEAIPAACRPSATLVHAVAIRAHTLELLKILDTIFALEREGVRKAMCESCGGPADVRLATDGSTWCWCIVCDAGVRVLGYDNDPADLL